MKQNYLLFIFILFWMINPQLQAQRSNAVLKPAADYVYRNAGANGELTADFVTITRFGTAPLTVQFKDASTGGPASWNWNFGDGTTDTVKNPLHTFETTGSFTIKLTVANGVSVNSITRSGYIRAVAPGDCDTLDYPLPGDYTYYIISSNGSGYVSGNNSYGDLAKASYFETEPTFLTGGFFDFAVAIQSITANREVKFDVWAADGNGGGPGTLLASQTTYMSEIVRDVAWERPTLIFLDEPLAIDAPFFMGVELPQTTGDTLALFTNKKGQGNPANGWEQHSTGNWYPYTDEQNSWNLKIDHAIFPILCSSTGIENNFAHDRVLIYPVPASDRLYVSLTDQGVKDIRVELLDLTGQIMVQQRDEVSETTAVDVSGFPEGVYLVRIFTHSGVIHRKIVIGR